MTKKRSLQQQIDRKAIAILSNKMPPELLMREQDEDFGIDIELELFKAGSSDTQESTGVLFKAQVKGVADGQSLSINNNKISKSFKIEDIHYWYEQLDIPVVIFLVDNKSEDVYWTDFYSNSKLREDYEHAQANKQKSLNIHFDKDRVFPQDINVLLNNITIARQRIALSSLYSQEALASHVEDLKDTNVEISKISNRMELTLYKELSDLFESNKYQEANDLATEILENRRYSQRVKFATVLALEPIYHMDIQNRNLERGATCGRPFLMLHAKVNECIEYIENERNIGEKDDIYQNVFSFWKIAIKIALYSAKLLDSSVQHQVFSNQEEDAFAMLTAYQIQKTQQEHWRCLKDAFSEYDQYLSNLTSSKSDSNLIQSLPYVACAMIDSMRPLYYYYNQVEDKEAKETLSNYIYGLGMSGFNSSILSGDVYVAQKIITNLCTFFITDGEESKGMQFAEQIASIDESDDDFISQISDYSKRFINDISKIETNQEPLHPMDERKEFAIKLAALEGMDISREPYENEYPDEIGMGIHRVLHDALQELDLTNYLKDCVHRHVYASRHFGCSAITPMYGLGFASQRKEFYCFKKNYRSREISYKTEDNYKRFKSKYCDGCKDIEPHSNEWRYDYNYQQNRDLEYSQMEEE